MEPGVNDQEEAEPGDRCCSESRVSDTAVPELLYPGSQHSLFPSSYARLTSHETARMHMSGLCHLWQAFILKTRPGLQE
jgi:hypothetical protein